MAEWWPTFESFDWPIRSMPSSGFCLVYSIRSLLTHPRHQLQSMGLIHVCVHGWLVNRDEMNLHFLPIHIQHSKYSRSMQSAQHSQTLNCNTASTQNILFPLPLLVLGTRHPRRLFRWWVQTIVCFCRRVCTLGWCVARVEERKILKLTFGSCVSGDFIDFLVVCLSLCL